MKKIIILFFIITAVSLSGNDLPLPEENLSPKVVPSVQDFNKIEENAVVTDNTEPFCFTFFSAIVRDDAVVISWKASHTGRNLILYRASQEFESLQSLANAVPVASITDKGFPYIDYPPLGLPYYYAIIEENELDSNIKFLRGKNTIEEPVSVLSSGQAVNVNGNTEIERALPLPVLNPKNEINKKSLFFSTETETIINGLTKNTVYEQFKLSDYKHEIYIFLEDTAASDSGEKMELYNILQKNFLTKNWNSAEKDLNTFLKIKRTSRTSARSLFYLAEALFFQKRYGDALLKFLAVQDLYPKQAAEWIQYCILELSNSSKQ